MTTNFLGIRIDGDITRLRGRIAQRPLEELAPIMQVVLDDPRIVEFGWAQHTPYFNDGEPCVFGVGEIWVRTDQDLTVEDDYDLEMYYHPTLGRNRYVDREIAAVELPPELVDLADQCVELGKAISGGAFDDVLLDAFGDHAEITVKRDAITVEFYEHD